MGNHPVRHQPANPEAHDAYFRGRYSLNQRTEVELQNALGYFHAAIEADPDYALAYAGIKPDDPAITGVINAWGPVEDVLSAVPTGLHITLEPEVVVEWQVRA